MTEAGDHRTGAVVIGRNEGERLMACLRSVAPRVDALVYVDSGSSDGSREVAREHGAAFVFDPRGVGLGRHAKHRIKFRPGTDVALYNAMLHQFVENGFIDEEMVEEFEDHPRVARTTVFVRTVIEKTPSVVST